MEIACQHPDSATSKAKAKPILTPPVGTTSVTFLEVLLDGLLGVFPLGGLLEGLG